jgi:type II secretory pathway pseudopilin PulG
MPRRRARRKDSGFALLLILLLAAVIAITLYMEIPRVAFETQRQKEQLLVARGEQYKRAIQLPQ